MAATLRPETMYGQTNCWVGPTIPYVAFETVNGEVYVCTTRAAKNMSFQGFTKENGKVEPLVKLTGQVRVLAFYKITKDFFVLCLIRVTILQDIMGMALKAPLTKFDKIYTLPMLTVKANKGSAS